MKRNVLNSPRLLELKKNRRRTILNKILVFLLGLLAVFSLLAYLSKLDNLNISEIQIAGNKVVDTEALRTTVEEQIAGKYLWLFHKTNVLYYPQNIIKKELQDKFNRLKDIDLSIYNNKILLVSTAERTAKYTWCGAARNALNIDEQCYFLDEDGYVFDKAPYFSGEVYFKFYGLAHKATAEGLANINTDNPLGHGPTGEPLGSYFSKQNFKQLASFKDTLVGIGLKPAAMYVKDDGDAEIFLSRGSSVGPKIIFRINSDFQNIAENLEAALTTEPLQSKFKNNYSSLLYIDLRFGNKVYYKFSAQGGSASGGQ